MTKNGNVFKEDNIYIHSDDIYITSKDKYFINFNGIGNDVDYPTSKAHYLKLRLIQPLIGTLSKGQEYTFELRCETVEKIVIYYGEIREELLREDKIYKKTITINPSTTATILKVYNEVGSRAGNIYEYKIE